MYNDTGFDSKLKLILKSFPVIIGSMQKYKSKAINFDEINISGIPSVCQTFWTQIRPDVLSSLILVQTACKCY